MAEYRVVITDYEYESLQIERDIFASMDIEFVTAQCKTEEEVIAAAVHADGILNQYAPITAKVIDSLQRCKVISRYGVGVNTIDLDAATRKGIVVANCTDYCVDEVADHAMALLLGAARKVSLLNSFAKAGVWDYKKAVPIYGLRGKTLGLAGFGKIAQNLCLKARAFGLRVLAYDPFVPKELASSVGAQLADLSTLCVESDFISVHLPLTDDTRGLIGKEQFNRMKREAVIINTSRGPVIDERALIDAIQSGQIAGAALDVLEREPMNPDHPFARMEQVVVTPHAAWYSEESERQLKRHVAQNVADVLSGFYPAYVANPEVKSRLGLKENT